MGNGDDGDDGMFSRPPTSTIIIIIIKVVSNR
jgi:hypothetical protein